jgi:hypothetical protein
VIPDSERSALYAITESPSVSLLYSPLCSLERRSVSSSRSTERRDGEMG